MFQWILSGYFSELSGLSASLGWAVWVYQLPREFGSFNGLAVLCAFQWTVCVWVFCGDSIDWWLWVF